MVTEQQPALEAAHDVIREASRRGLPITLSDVTAAIAAYSAARQKVPEGSQASAINAEALATAIQDGWVAGGRVRRDVAERMITAAIQAYESAKPLRRLVMNSVTEAVLREWLRQDAMTVRDYGEMQLLRAVTKGLLNPVGEPVDGSALRDSRNPNNRYRRAR